MLCYSLYLSGKQIIILKSLVSRGIRIQKIRFVKPQWCNIPNAPILSNLSSIFIIPSKQLWLKLSLSSMSPLRFKSTYYMPIFFLSLTSTEGFWEWVFENDNVQYNLIKHACNVSCCFRCDYFSRSNKHILLAPGM